MKKPTRKDTGKVEWLYLFSMLMEDGKIGIDYQTTSEKLTAMDVQEMAIAMKTNLRVDYLGTLIQPKKETTFSYDSLTEEETELRRGYAEKRQKEADNAKTVQQV